MKKFWSCIWYSYLKVNRLRPNDASMWPKLFHVMACRLWGTKPLPEAVTNESFSRHWSFLREFHCSSMDFPYIKPVTRTFYVFFDVHVNIRLNKQTCWWWFETPWRPCEVNRFVSLLLTDDVKNSIGLEFGSKINRTKLIHKYVYDLANQWILATICTKWVPAFRHGRTSVATPACTSAQFFKLLPFLVPNLTDLKVMIPRDWGVTL